MKLLLTMPFFILLFALTGCAANGPKYSEQYANEHDDSNFYIYRPDTIWSSAINSGVFIDDELIGTLQNGSFVSANISEGEHTIKVGKQLKKFTVSNDSKTYFKFKYGWALFFVIPISPQALDEVSEAIAINELNETRSPEKI